MHTRLQRTSVDGDIHMRKRTQAAEGTQMMYVVDECVGVFVILFVLLLSRNRSTYTHVLLSAKESMITGQDIGILQRELQATSSCFNNPHPVFCGNR